MKNQFNRQHRYNNSRTARATSQQITRFTILDSSGPLGKLRGTALQLAEKYQAGAKDAQTQGDVVLVQTCQQYADHYLRLQAIALENEQPKTQQEETAVEESEAAVSSETQSPSDLPPADAVAEKHSTGRHKKVDNSLSMPMEALQEKSEPIE